MLDEIEMWGPWLEAAFYPIVIVWLLLILLRPFRMDNEQQKALADLEEASFPDLTLLETTYIRITDYWPDRSDNSRRWLVWRNARIANDEYEQVQVIVRLHIKSRLLTVTSNISPIGDRPDGWPEDRTILPEVLTIPPRDHVSGDIVWHLHELSQPLLQIQRSDGPPRTFDAELQIENCHDRGHIRAFPIEPQVFNSRD